MRKLAVALVIILSFSCSSEKKTKEGYIYIIQNQSINVDGNLDDWIDIKGNKVENSDRLWIGQGLKVENWNGKKDLSFEWKSCWSEDMLYFLFDVQDNILVEPALQPNSFLNDCIEIMLDPKNVRGPRFTVENVTKNLIGYEMHFLPAVPNHVFLNDSMAPMYHLELEQDSLFESKWNGLISCSKKGKGYILEIGFKVPDLKIVPGLMLGLDVAVCDDDGAGRKSLMIWSGTKSEFWLNMDEYPKVIFK